MPDLPPTPQDEHKMPAQPELENELPPDPVLQRAQDAERQRDEYFHLLRQSQADYENAHQRNRREREQDRRFAAKPLAFDLLPVIDNLERAMTAAKQGGDTSPLAQGVALVHRQILDALKRHGITKMEALHQPFDPHLHEALLQLATDEFPPGTVLQVDQPGFMIHDQVLRPARVIIASAPQANG